MVGGADSKYAYEIISTWGKQSAWHTMAAEASSSSSSSTPSAVGGEEPLHLLVVIVDASDSFTHSCSLQDPAQRVCEFMS